MSGGPWTEPEMEKMRAKWKKMEVERVKKMKLEGYDLSLIAVPLPCSKNLKKYTRDAAVKKFLKPYQTINPYRLKKPIVD